MTARKSKGTPTTTTATENAPALLDVSQPKEAEAEQPDERPMHERVMPSFGGGPITPRDITFLLIGLHAALEVLSKVVWSEKLNYLGKVLHRGSRVPPNVLHDVAHHVLRSAVDAANVRDAEGALVINYPPAELSPDVDAYGTLIEARIREATKPAPEQKVKPATLADMPKGTVPFGKRGVN